jgi:hypothetical protein
MDMKTALQIFNIKNGISLRQLKFLYRKLSKKHHPDISGNSDEIIRINDAYDFLKQYIENYEISVKELAKGSVEERTFGRFENDWLGGNLNG